MLVPDTWRVRLVELGEFSINVEIFAQVNTTDIKIFLEVAESLNLGAIGVLNKAGVKLAVPSR